MTANPTITQYLSRFYRLLGCLLVLSFLISCQRNAKIIRTWTQDTPALAMLLNMDYSRDVCAEVHNPGPAGVFVCTATFIDSTGTFTKTVRLLIGERESKIIAITFPEATMNLMAADEIAASVLSATLKQDHTFTIERQ